MGYGGPRDLSSVPTDVPRLLLGGDTAAGAFSARGHNFSKISLFCAQVSHVLLCGPDLFETVSACARAARALWGGSPWSRQPLAGGCFFGSKDSKRNGRFFRDVHYVSGVITRNEVGAVRNMVNPP